MKKSLKKFLLLCYAIILIPVFLVGFLCVCVKDAWRAGYGIGYVFTDWLNNNNTRKR